jgi:hypothetical protein
LAKLRLKISEKLIFWRIILQITELFVCRVQFMILTAGFCMYFVVISLLSYLHVCTMFIISLVIAKFYVYVFYFFMILTFDHCTVSRSWLHLLYYDFLTLTSSLTLINRDPGGPSSTGGLLSFDFAFTRSQFTSPSIC